LAFIHSATNDTECAGTQAVCFMLSESECESVSKNVFSLKKHVSGDAV